MLFATDIIHVAKGEPKCYGKVVLFRFFSRNSRVGVVHKFVKIHNSTVHNIHVRTCMNDKSKVKLMFQEKAFSRQWRFWTPD